MPPDEQTSVPRHLQPQVPVKAKPAIGDPCNRCGRCCHAQVCSTGSFAFGLVTEFGERAKGPCPALEADGDGFACGLARRPKHYMPGHRVGVTRLKEAVLLLIGTGFGCDYSGDEPDETARPKLRALAERFFGRRDRKAFRAAERVLLRGRSPT